jgi:holo-[acyl-carrier protein] synthase
MDDGGELEQAISRALDAATDSTVRFIGLGVDIVQIDRFRSDRKRWGSAFLEKSFTFTEIEYCSSKKDSDTTFAGTFAAKEAVFKALTLEWTGSFTWRWIEIQRNRGRQPSVVVDEQLFALREELRCASIAVSITHAGEYAAAVALLTGT